MVKQLMKEQRMKIERGYYPEAKMNQYLSEVIKTKGLEVRDPDMDKIERFYKKLVSD